MIIKEVIQKLQQLKDKKDTQDLCLELRLLKLSQSESLKNQLIRKYFK